MRLRMLHGYQYLDARAKAGAPAKANKELSLMSTICKSAVRWGVIEAMPFTDIMQNDIEKDVRTITRSQVVRFYLWSLRQTTTFRNLGCAAMLTYLTGFAQPRCGRSYRWQNEGRRACHQRQAQEGPGRGDATAGVVD